jgi:hypothetical protein
MAAAQLAGEDFLAGTGWLRADEAGQQVTPVPGLACSIATGLARRLAALPERVREGARPAGRKIELRADAGYFAGDLARAAAGHGVEFAIGARRITSMWRALAGIADGAWRDATGMQNAQVAVSPYAPADWPERTVLLIRRVRLDPGQVSAGPGRGAAAPCTPASGRCRCRSWRKKRPSAPAASSSPASTFPPRPGPPPSTGAGTAPAREHLR